MVRGGYVGKYLDVDLTTGTLHDVTLPEETLATWIGGTGLGLHLLAQELVPGMKPDDPEAPIFILSGPLTGTTAPQSSNWTIVTLNTVLPDHPGVSQSHGYWGARLRHAGWDGIFIRGISPKPVYIWIDDGKVELKDAAVVWGKDTFETERRIALDLGDEENISVACIGQGGEALLPGASVRTDRAYGASKGGPGVVWGAKKLKAIATRGTGPVPIAEPDAFLKTTDDWIEAWKKTYVIGENRTQPEGIKIMAEIAAFGGFPGKNFSDPEYAARWGKKLDEDVACWKVEAVGSWNCDLQCHNETTITTGPFTGYTVRGYTGEVIEEVGPNLGIEDPGTALMLCGYYDGLGLDCCEVPRIIGSVMEAYNTGRLTIEDTDLIDLTWGNYEGIIQITERILERKGIGATLAKGLAEATRELGIEDLAVHIKGVGFNTHDQRGFGLGWLFGSVMSGIGPSWQGVGFEMRPEPDLGFDTTRDPASPDDKGRQSYLSQTKKMWEDCTGCCWFATWGLPGALVFAPQAVSQATGWQFNREMALLLGERIINLQRLLCLYLGFNPESESDLGSRVADAPPSGPAEGRALGPHLKGMREEYYAALGWDPDTGAPSDRTLERVGLKGYRVGRS